MQNAYNQAASISSLGDDLEMLRKFKAIPIGYIQPFEFGFGQRMTSSAGARFGAAGSPQQQQQPNCSWGSQMNGRSPRPGQQRRPGTSGGLSSPRITAQNPYADNRPSTVESPRGGGRAGSSHFATGEFPGSSNGSGSSPAWGGSSSPRLGSPRGHGAQSPKSLVGSPSPKRLWHGGSGVGVNGANSHGYDPQTGSPVPSRLEFPHRDVLPQHNDFHYTARLQATLPAVGVRAGSVHPLHPNHPGAQSETAGGASSPLTRASIAAAPMGTVQGTPTAKRSPRPLSQGASQQQASPKPSLYYRCGYQGHEFISIA